MTAPQALNNKDYFLRVTPGSQLGRMMDAMVEGKTISGHELEQIGGQKQSPWFLSSAIPNNFDNVTVERPERGATYAAGKYKLHYTDVVGRAATTVVNVESANMLGGGSGTGQEEEEFEDFQWPIAPPMLKPMSFFRKPNWYNMTRDMVVMGGKHISLAGPPGVGKDTAVMQMAAEEFQPLVVIGGDAGLRKRDLIGSVEMKNGRSYFQIAEFAAAVVNGWWTLLTEVNAAEPDALLLLNGIVETPHTINIHGRSYPVHPNFRMFISYNPGLIGTKPLPQSFKDRYFPVVVDFLSEIELRRRLEAHGMPKVEELEQILVNGNSIPKNDWPDKIIRYGMAMWESHTNGRMSYQITVRRLKDAVDLMNMGITDDVKKALKQAVNAAIDAPIQRKVADQLLDSIM